ncbi:MAG TPA: hypothetical protein VHA70_15165 [Bauldia sp.]|nr:hypothetical protein [Bauldia sp.]
MAKYFLIGEAGDEGMWLVDLESKSVERIENREAAVGLDLEPLRGVDMAIVAEGRSSPSAHNRLQVAA